MPPTYFPLRWESTGDQWWYASPIDYAAANGQYDLVRELIRIDSNHLIKLTSLRRIRRLETVWDDEEQFHGVAKCRAHVARKLFHECESKQGKNSLIRAGYGGWLIYTASSAGQLGFVQELLERNPLLVFGEGEFGVTDILYAAARSKNAEVFRLLFDFAVSPRFSGRGGELEEHIGEIPCVYKREMVNRAVHAAVRGGNLLVLKELLSDCNDVLAYRDVQGSTILHAAAGKGRVEVVKYLIAAYDIINSKDHQGNTALHVAASRGQLAAVESLLSASPSSMISTKNNSGETFLHKVISGFQTPAFRRLDRQIHLLKNLVCGRVFDIEEVINAKNNEGRTALHTAIIGNVHSDLVQLLMMSRSIDVNVRDVDGMTALDYLRQWPRSASSDILIRQLISAGGIFGCQDYYSARKAIASHLKMQGDGGSPGTSFKISDTEIFLYTGVENVPVASAGHQHKVSIGSNSSSPELNPRNTTDENQSSISTKKPSGSVNHAAQRLKRAIGWPRIKEKKPERFKKSVDFGSTTSDEAPTPLRQRFSKASSSLPNNKRTLAVRSNQSSPTAKKKFASGLRHGVMQAIPHITVPGRSRSSSFSKSSSLSSPSSLDKQKGVCIDTDATGPSWSNQVDDDDTPNLGKQGSLNRRLRRHYFCFGASGLSVKHPVSRQHQNQSFKPPPVISVA
ncbi:uncharacterized protein LOC133726705 [Rosa rugosa]|uniref:uncharacterized protein LOC133726705 n=1 Tax=Rosa rugosa TaxID=74645 RepID=UPI002B40AD5C|nr:uncharacterized protein LOC133726705 [Rosa rugosa]XP_062010291.1 uncharacterized protein LOC133726705 [Rosa rugosa]XP_062010292.1 uncharacterized protein LOC133726705 [Rosa rugosa]XP_062010293.1 uncharacterized protein LOC133726705 [Rosa rugosa]